MIWILAALLAAFLWAFSNIADQISIRKFFDGVSSLEIMVTSGFISFVPFIICAVFRPEIFNAALIIILIFIATSFINFIGFIGYCKALKHDEASNAVPILQLQPILIFIGAYFLLGETATWLQILGSLLIIISSIAVIYNPKTKNINWMTFGFMGMCTIMLSITTLIDRYYLTDHNIHWVTVMAWKSLGYTICSICFLSIRPRMRQNMIMRFQNPIQYGLHLLFTIEIAAIIANFAFIFALALAPSAGVTQSLMGIIPFFVVAMGYLGHRLFPEFVEKPKTGKHLITHLIFLATILIGLFLLLYDV